MPLLVRKADDLILNAGTIAWPDPVDFAAVQGRAVQVFQNHPFGFRGRPGDGTIHPIVQFSAVKKRKRRHPFLRAFFRLLLVAAVLAAGIAVWKNWDKLAPEALLDWIDLKLAGADKGDGFPYTISGDTVVAMGQAKNNLVLLTDTSLLFINEKGGEVARGGSPEHEETASPACNPDHVEGGSSLLSSLSSAGELECGTPSESETVKAIYTMKNPAGGFSPRHRRRIGHGRLQGGGLAGGERDLGRDAAV